MKSDEMPSASGAIDPITLVDPELRPMVQLIQQMMAAAPPPSIEAMVQARGAANVILPPQAATPSCVERLIPGPDGAPELRVYVINGEAGAARPGILHMHGGGYVGGAVQDYVGHLQAVAAELDCVIVSVDYRLAPETAYPGALEDNYTALRWAHANADEIGLDRGRIALMGESAGGGHAAALAFAARDRGEIPIMLQVLLYPMIDDRTGTTTPVPAHIGSLVWTSDANRLGWTALLGHAPGGADTPPGAAVARLQDLAGLPPTFIATGALDLFVSEDIAYAARLIDAGVPTELYVAPGAYHAFDLVSPDAGVSRAFTGAKLGALRRAFGQLS